METLFSNKKFFLIVDAVIILLCIAGFYQLVVKPDLPNYISVSNSTKENHYYQYFSSDSVFSIDGNTVADTEELEIFLNKMRIGDSVTIQIGSSEQQISVQLNPFYSLTELIIIAIVGVLFILSGMFVLLRCFNKPHAHIFHWSCLSTASIMFMSWGAQGQMPEWFSFIIRTGYHAAYAFVPASILHFTLLFPKEKFVNRKHLLMVLYSISALFTISLSVRYVFIIIGYSEITAPFSAICSSNLLFSGG